MRKKWVTIILPLSKRFWSRKPTTFRQIIYSHGGYEAEGIKVPFALSEVKKWQCNTQLFLFKFVV